MQAARAGYGMASFLEQTEARAAIVARVGTDQSRRGIRYTHAGLALKDHPRGRWHIVHLLNHCGSSSSELFDDGPMNIFLERPFSYDALVVIPSVEVQEGLIELMAGGAEYDLHEPRYSALAHPQSHRFQNSNQWILELVAVALRAEPAARWDRTAAQQILTESGFVPARMKLGFFERVGARRMDNVSLRDHSRRELRKGGYEWVSVASLVRYLEQQGHLLERHELVAAPVP